MLFKNQVYTYLEQKIKKQYSGKTSKKHWELKSVKVSREP